MNDQAATIGTRPVAPEGTTNLMGINRRLLYAGTFLIAIGAVLVLADGGRLATSTIAEALRLWPLVPIAIGAGIVLRRTSAAVPAGILAAAIPGVVLGSAIAVVPRFAVDCVAERTPAAVTVSEGTLGDGARVNVVSGCGSLIVTTSPGNGWRFEAADTAGGEPAIEASSRLLAIDIGGEAIWDGHRPGLDDARLTLPTSSIEDLDIVLNAGHGEIELPGARIGRFDLTTNASQASADLSDSSLEELTASVNAGSLAIELPASGDFGGSLQVNAGALDICAPPELGLRVTQEGALGSFQVRGEHQSGETWLSSGYATATYQADLDVQVNFGKIEINPIGGCE